MRRGGRPAFTSPTGPILQIKIWLVGISPMIWRRVLLPISWTLEVLHGVIQAAMGWKGLHLYEFRIRSARYGSPDLCVLIGVQSWLCRSFGDGGYTGQVIRA